ncbi:hypothetical protein KAM471c_34990 [Aeromonas caviae]|nr:hypothetical protein KAM345_035900 [Aeromonas caviae]BDN89684.1 hypothetical protein KAM471c_34990 [Aeromonas caviae]
MQSGHFVMQLGVGWVLDELQQTVLTGFLEPSLGLEGVQLFHMRSCMGMKDQYACRQAGGERVMEP